VNRAIPFFLLLVVCGCDRNPSVEEVRYTSYSNRYKNNLWIKVNTGKDFFKGRESAFSYKRCNYTFSMATKTNCYTEPDMEVSIFPSSSEEGFKAKKAEVTIRDVDSQTILVSVSIDDDRIPRLINGIYTLKVAEKTTDHVWYRTK
jgi:hypothetical protein